MNTRSRGLTGLGIAGGAVALLANVGGAHDTLTDVWPVVAALSPVLASALLVVGLALVGEVAWRWYAPRRPSVRFRRLAPEILAMLKRDWFPSSQASDEQVFDWIATHKKIDLELRALGVTLPFSRSNCLELLPLAEDGQVKKARNKFPPGFSDWPF